VRITSAAMGTALCVLAVACGLFMVEQLSADRAKVSAVQQRFGQVIADRVGPLLASGDAAGVQSLLADAEVFPRIAKVELRAADGRAIAAFHNSRLPEAGGVAVISRLAVAQNGRPAGVLLVESRLEPVLHALPRYLGLFGGLFFAAVACSLFIGRMMAARVIEPVARLSTAMQDIAVSGDLTQRVDPAADDEIGRLILSFNTLLHRLQTNEGELRRTMSALVIARDQADAANVQKSQFLANMSHEIRTPLNGVLAMAQIMARGELGPGQKGRLDVIRSSGEALLTILNDILDVSKIEAGALTLESLDFDLPELARAALESFSAVAEGKGVALTLEVEPGASGLRVGDPARLRQILSNLISNALKFTDAGSVGVRLEPLAGDEGVRLVVRDSGIGIPDDKLAMLFQKFTQLDASTTRRFGGTGLGLAICQELTQMMGGKIFAQSREGEGSVFTVELPLERGVVAPASLPIPALEAPDQDRPLRILAAEDNPTNKLVLATILEMFGADLQIVDNGSLAVQALEDANFDVVLMDIQMPVMDGIAAAKAIRSRENDQNRRRTPIIAVSANAMSHQVQEYMAAGMDGHVAKPIEITRLQSVLETVLFGGLPEPVAEIA
jgi:signal transduction histidine kinase/ActR/RegA family two-component response regulator